MKLLFNSFWRALAYCLRPDVLIFLLVPWLVITAVTLGWCYFYWKPYLQLMREWVGERENINLILNWLANSGFNLRSAFPALLLIFMMVPVVMVFTLLLISHMVTPVLVDLVRVRRFLKLDARRNVSRIQHFAWSMWHVLLLFVSLAVAAPVSILIPPLGFLLLPVLGGWFSTRIIAFSVLVHHASKAERLLIFNRHETPLISIGMFAGYLGLVPSLVAGSVAWLSADFTVWVPTAIGTYVLIAVFSSLWFSHYCLSALQDVRKEQMVELEKKAKEKVAADALKAAEAAKKASEEAKKVAEKTAVVNAMAALSKPPPPKKKWWQTIVPKMKEKITNLKKKFPKMGQKKP